METFPVPAEAGVYEIGPWRVHVRRRRPPTAWLRAAKIRERVEALGLSRTDFCTKAGVDNSFTGARIWRGDIVPVQAPTAEAIAEFLQLPIAAVAYVTKDGAYYEPRVVAPAVVDEAEPE